MKRLRTLLCLTLTLAAVTSCTAAAQQASAPTPQAAPKYSELYYQRASLFEILPVDSTTIVFMGNSLTHGCEWHELLGKPNVVNRGINGDIVEGIAERIAPVLAGRPAKIFLLAGANDVSHDLTADSIVTAIGQLLDIIKAGSPSTRVYLQSMLPINNSFNRYKKMAGKEDVIRQINAALEPLASSKGVTWVNINPAFCDADGNLRRELTNDGLHLLGPAYLIWRDIVMPYVEE